jgi:hypothetical protein
MMASTTRRSGMRWWIVTNLLIFGMSIGFMPLTDGASCIALLFWMMPCLFWGMEEWDR